MLVGGIKVFGYMESAYQMDPYNITSDYNVAMNIQHAAQDLHQISSDVHYMRQSIWTNQFLSFFTGYGYGGGSQVAYERDYELENRVSKLETAKRVKESSLELLNAWTKIMDLYKTAYGRTKEIDVLVAELKKLGSWFVSDMGWQDFMVHLKAELDDVGGKAKLVSERLEPIAGSGMEIFDQIEYVQEEIYPIFDDLSSQVATMDFKLEIGVNILKACIGLKRLDMRQGELFNESEKVIKDLESGKLELPFSIELLNKSLDVATAEVNEMRDLGKECKETGLLLGDEYEDMTAWVKQMEYRVQAIQEAYVENIAKLQDLKRIYEVYWFKNH
jgi:hypothetical protein